MFFFHWFNLQTKNLVQFFFDKLLVYFIHRAIKTWLHKIWDCIISIEEKHGQSVHHYHIKRHINMLLFFFSRYIVDENCNINIEINLHSDSSGRRKFRIDEISREIVDFFHVCMCVSNESKWAVAMLTATVDVAATAAASSSSTTRPSHFAKWVF